MWLTRLALRNPILILMMSLMVLALARPTLDDVQPEDEIVKKYRYSGFLPGTSDLADRLRARGFDTVLITGTVTNVCCESSARDANMMNFRTIMVSDGNAALTQAEHNYRTVLELFRMPAADYQRFMDFLRHHELKP